MSLLVTGSIGIDTVSSPHGQAAKVLGGSAVYFSLAAAYYVPVRLVGVVGDDFPEVHRRMLSTRPIDLTGLEVRRGSKTFRWTGRFVGDMNEAETVAVDLNVLAERGPTVPDSFRDSEFVFLANTHPTLQRELLSQLSRPKLVVCDTMNLWITKERDSLLETLGRVHGVILNDGEARLLTGKTNLVEAAESILGLGPRFVMVKKGEHGSLLASREEWLRFRRCRPRSSAIPPARATASPAASWDISVERGVGTSKPSRAQPSAERWPLRSPLRTSRSAGSND